ncbi:hypothetical protein [Alicyclobacillus acidiphilus]|uniref:hypothetical protein n=1 Tax=Alicyclobacillus acidiphilus TaxID=182455 RepID=UPI0008359963|nr:hypothetical protein [Alicyclobacillus acidiphilus]
MTSDLDQTADEIRRKTRQEIATQLTDLLPVPTIAKVCDMTFEQMLALVRRSESEGTVTREKSNRQPPHTIKLLDQPICRTTVPMAISTQRVIQRHEEAISKLKQYL